MTIKKQNFIGTFIWLLVALFEYLYLAGIYDYSLVLVSVAWVGILNIVLQIMIWKFTEQSLLSPFMVFIYCSYIFHFGQIIMTGIFPNVEFSYLNYITVYMSNHTVSIKTMKVVVNCINLIYLGGLFGSGSISSKDRTEMSSFDIESSKNEMLRISKILLIVSFPLRLFIDLQTLAAAVVGGYYAAIAVNYSGVVDCIAGFWYSAVILYYLGLDDRKKKRRFLIFVVAYLLIVMLTGNRGHQMVCLLMLFIVVYEDRNKKFSLKTVVSAILLMYGGMVIIDFIYTMRELGISYFFSNIGAVIGESLRANILFETIGSFGETIFTPYLVIEGIDSSSINPGFGECFYKSLVSIFPAIGSTMAKINVEANFAKMLNTLNAIGGSIVGELYYNFRGFYSIFAVIAGFLLSKISSKVTNGLIKKNYNVLLYAIPIFTNLVWWCRDSISNAMRSIVWICCFIWLARRVRRPFASHSSQMIQPEENR